jgi:hypothetical protein
VERAEAAGTLLLHLLHPDVLLPPVARERHFRKEGKGQYAQRKVFQAIKQVGSLALRAPAFLPGLWTAA